ncbi:MAG TPA: glycerol-3-phosphate dehydrogenase/oxidase [Cyclobacteriaceae bacterium]
MIFSSTNRKYFIDALKRKEFDLIVIGGGITGAGIALDAASRGLVTALVDQSDFASGTSSRSTKLIHGGLRYLKQFEFALVKEVGSERAVVHKLAPHLVLPEKMLLPLREKRGFGSLFTSFGLRLYDWLAGVTGKDRRLILTRFQTLRREPLLKIDNVKGGALYAEYRTDDARLTIEIVKKAAKYGATALNYCKVTRLGYNEEGKVNGVQVEDAIDKEQFSVSGRVVINASGPWVDEIREIDKSKKGKRLHLTKGVHIVFPREKFPVRQSIYFDIADGRMIFAIPRGRTTYVGTTDTNYKDQIGEVATKKEDAEYLISGINENFPTVNLTLEDIESSWAGLRPLIYEEGKSASELSRKDEVFVSPSGLYSIAGGKLTGYRKMAERVIDMIIEKSPKRKGERKCYTNKIRLSDGKLTSTKSVRRYINAIKKQVAKMGLNVRTAHYLVENYGKKTDEIMKRVAQLKEDNAELSLIKSELHYTVEKEMTCSSTDFWMRRTGRLYFNIKSVIRYKNEINKELAVILGWDENHVLADLELLNQEIDKSIGFK